MTTAATMKAVRFHSYGAAEVLRYEDAPRPAPGAGQVLIRVGAAGVNAIDWKIRAGYLKDMIPYALPVTLGLDFSGTVTAAGPGAGDVAVGSEVYGRVDLMRLGTYAEYVIALPGEFTTKPRSLDHAHAAAVPLVALTAWQSLVEGANGAPAIGLTPGQRLLVHGAAGGVGSFAIQIAKSRGAHVIATVRSQDAGFVRRLGADEVIDYTVQRFEDVVGTVDAVLDLVGGETQARSWGILREGGALASTMGPPSEQDAAAHGARAIGVMAQMDVAQLSEIARLIDAGTLTPAVSEVLPLREAGLAHTRLETGQVQGKIVLDVAG
jgi:NADPH:quinone reductase-like Zn-dependent oxidoreductase